MEDPRIRKFAHTIINNAIKLQKDEKILILRAEQGSEILTEVLDDAGMIYTDVKIYDILVDEDKRNFANEKAREMDFITFASGSGVRGFMENGGTIPAGTKAVCIGTSTARMSVTLRTTASLSNWTVAATAVSTLFVPTRSR